MQLQCARTASMSLVGDVSAAGREALYSCDLRWRVVWLHISQELTFREIGQKLCIARSTAHAVFSKVEETGEVEQLKQPLKEDRRKLDCHHELLLIALVLEPPLSIFMNFVECFMKLQVFLYLKLLLAGC